MARMLGTPQRWHDRNHRGGTVETCWECGRDAAVCRSKRRFESYEAADQAVRETNESEGYTQPVVRYRCRWCLYWHMATATGKVRVRRAERRRREWLVAKVLSGA